jgi:uncharacterized membrane protein YfcA
VSPALIAATALVGLVVGMLGALLGVGGGLMMVPFMVLVLDRTQHVAEGTSLLVIIPTAAVGAIAHYTRGYVSLRAAGLLGVGGVIGAIAGARLALGVSAPILESLFGFLVIGVGIRFIQQGITTSKDAAADRR